MYLTGMMKNIYFTLFCFVIFHTSRAQSDTSSALNNPIVKILNEVKSYQIDTSAVPEDKLTRKIRELRSLRNGFNINELIDYKLNEDQNKKDSSASKALKEQFTKGNGKRWMDNSVIWIYRRQFSYNEVKKMVKFYRTSAGRKMADAFPVVVLESLMAFEKVQKQLMNK